MSVLRSEKYRQVSQDGPSIPLYTEETSGERSLHCYYPIIVNVIVYVEPCIVMKLKSVCIVVGKLHVLYVIRL